MTPPKTLRDLVREHIDRTGDSYAQIAKKSGLSKPQIGIIANEDRPRVYRTETVEGIARGLEVPLSVVARAASASAGRTIDAPTEPSARDDARRIAALLEHLSDEELEHMRVMIQALVDHRAPGRGR